MTACPSDDELRSVVARMADVADLRPVWGLIEHCDERYACGARLVNLAGERPP